MEYFDDRLDDPSRPPGEGRLPLRPPRPADAGCASAGLRRADGPLRLARQPYERLARTARVIARRVFGPRAEADRLTRRVRAMHRRVHGVLAEPAGRFPAGTPYAADDPELLLWVLATLADSGRVVYERYVRPLEPVRARRPTGATIARSAACSACDAGQMPDSLDDYSTGCWPDPTWRSPTSPESSPCGSCSIRPSRCRRGPVLELANFVTVGLLPTRLRREYRLRWDPARTSGPRRRSGVRQADSSCRCCRPGSATRAELIGHASRARRTRETRRSPQVSLDQPRDRCRVLACEVVRRAGHDTQHRARDQTGQMLADRRPG